MECARIAVFEDNGIHQEVVKQAAEWFGHEIVLSCDSLKFAMESLDLVAQKKLEVDAYILDANLGVERDGRDARILYQKMGEIGVKGLRIGYSADDYPVPVDFDSHKNAIEAMEFVTNAEDTRDE